MHPEATADPATLRWVVPIGALPAVGRVTTAPGELGALVASGDAAVEVTPAAVTITLREPLTWRRDGARLRSALTSALALPAEWTTADPDASRTSGTSGADDAGTIADLDAHLRRLVQEAIDGAPGDYVRSHHGSVSLVDVTAGCVTLRLTGACSTCPASAFTLHRHFEAELRRRCPELVSVSLAHTG